MDWMDTETMKLKAQAVVESSKHWHLFGHMQELRYTAGLFLELFLVGAQDGGPPYWLQQHNNCYPVGNMLMEGWHIHWKPAGHSFLMVDNLDHILPGPRLQREPRVHILGWTFLWQLQWVHSTVGTDVL